MSIDVRAFSLLELLAAIALLLVLGGLSVPSLASMMRENALKHAVEELETALRTAQLLGMERRTEENVLVQNDHFLARRGGEWRQFDFPSGVSLTAPGAPYPVIVRFHASGAASPLTLVIEGEPGICRLTVSLRGRITNSCRRDSKAGAP